MKDVKTYIYISAIFITLVLLFLLRTIPGGQLWDEYNVLYVSDTVSDSVVSNILKQNGIKDYISLNNQYLPVNLAENSVEVSMYKINSNLPENDYIKNRSAFFFDKAHKYRLYYISVRNRNELKKSISDFDKQGINVGVDNSSSYPGLLPVFVLLLIVILSLYSKNKILFISSSMLTYVFLIFNPFFPVAVSCCLLLLVEFIVSNLWNRDGAKNVLTKTVYILVIFVISLISTFSSAVKTGFLFILTTAATICFYMAYKEIESFLESKQSFTPVLIRPAKMISFYSNKIKVVLPSVLICMVLLLSTYTITSNKNISAHFAKILLPSETKSLNYDLPQLEDYYKWVWDIKTYPYKSLNIVQTSQNFIEYSEFTVDEGKIKEDKKLLAYNQNFKDNTFNDIDYLQFNAVEKLMKSEGQSALYGYSASTSYTVNIVGIISMIISLVLLLFIFISSIIKEGSKK